MQYAQASGGEIIRVLVADDTRIHTQLLADALRQDRQLEVLSSPSNSHELIEAARSQKVDIFVLSCKFGEEPLSGIEILRELTASHPTIRAIMLMDSSKKETIVQAFRAGAKGIFSRQESVETLCKCIRSVHGGQIWANSQQMSFAVEALASSPVVRALDANGMSLLSRRELDVVHSLAEGLTNREIAERLGLSQHTIKNYLFRVFDKLGVSNRLELLFMTLSQVRGPESPAGSSLQSSGNGNSHRMRTTGENRPRRPESKRKPPHAGLQNATESQNVPFRVTGTFGELQQTWAKRDG
jgi:two-component system nitrate/nitrite response regulator NarL